VDNPEEDRKCYIDFSKVCGGQIIGNVDVADILPAIIARRVSESLGKVEIAQPKGLKDIVIGSALWNALRGWHCCDRRYWQESSLT
jgi:hypothetical protein